MSLVENNKIGLGTAVIIGLNAMIGVGIISVPALLSTNTGPAGILTFLFSICAVLLIALSLGDAAHRFPGEGWNYLYPSKWGGHLLGMVSASAYFIGVTIAMGFLTQVAGIYAANFIPIDPQLLGILILLALTSVVVAGAEISTLGQYIIIASVMGPLLLTSLFCWYHFDIANTMPFIPYGVGSIFAAAPKALFGLLGFESIVSLYAIVREPQKNVPRAAVLSITIIGAFYIFFASGVIFSVAPKFFTQGAMTSLSSVLGAAFPAYPLLATFVTIGALFGIIGTLHSMIWSLSVLLLSILRRAKRANVLVDKGLVNAKVSTLIVGVSIFVFAILMHGETLVDLTAFFIVPSYILSIFGLLLIKDAWKGFGNIRTLGALATALVMFYYASQPVVNLFRNFIA